ncbi:MAG: hypothetical protein AAF799_01545 [Myxococcota bacterium]
MSDLAIVRHLYDAEAGALWCLDEAGKWTSVACEKEGSVVVPEDLGNVEPGFRVVPMVYVRGGDATLSVRVTPALPGKDEYAVSGFVLVPTERDDDGWTHLADFKLVPDGGRVRYRVQVFQSGEARNCFDVDAYRGEGDPPAHLRRELVSYESLLETELLDAVSRLALNGLPLTNQQKRYCASQGERGVLVAKRTLELVALNQVQARQRELLAEAMAKDGN